jgi:hypothetical protein
MRSGYNHEPPQSYGYATPRRSSREAEKGAYKVDLEDATARDLGENAGQGRGARVWRVRFVGQKIETPTLYGA